MVTANINRKSAQSQVSTWQETLQDYKAQMMKQQQTQQDAPESDKSTSAHKGSPPAGKRHRNLPANRGRRNQSQYRNA
ncbi:hypothetical protein AXA91_16800 [Salmonella enterica]|nr:hypothetical protein [Salmonella enterica]